MGVVVYYTICYSNSRAFVANKTLPAYFPGPRHTVSNRLCFFQNTSLTTGNAEETQTPALCAFTAGYFLVRSTVACELLRRDCDSLSLHFPRDAVLTRCAWSRVGANDNGPHTQAQDSKDTRIAYGFFCRARSAGKWTT